MENKSASILVVPLGKALKSLSLEVLDAVFDSESHRNDFWEVAISAQVQIYFLRW